MTERMTINKVKKLRALEEQQEALQKQIDELKDQIKQDMEQKGLDEMKAGAFIIRWTRVFSNRFDTKAFQKEHKNLYGQYVRQAESRRFSVV